MVKRFSSRHQRGSAGSLILCWRVIRAALRIPRQGEHEAAGVEGITNTKPMIPSRFALVNQR
jgi:hypothetical protein